MLDQRPSDAVAEVKLLRDPCLSPAQSVDYRLQTTKGDVRRLDESAKLAMDRRHRRGFIFTSTLMTTQRSESPPSIRDHATRGLAEALGIEIVELTAERVVGTMPVDGRTRQPYGLLHGGASVALAETVASLASIMNIDRQRFRAVGLEINANHIRAKTEGTVRGTATPIHIGRSTHVWKIEIVDERDRLVCISRCTLAIIPTRPAE